LFSFAIMGVIKTVKIKNNKTDETAKQKLQKLFKHSNCKKYKKRRVKY